MERNRARAARMQRRQFLATGAAVAAAGSLAACDALSVSPSGTDTEKGGSKAPKEMQAPMLAERVRSGKLPELAERLPKDPLVVETVEGPGIYGGELRSAILGPAEAIQLDRIVGYDCLMRWTPDWQPDPIPNIALSVEVSEDATSYTFQLREGIKWSTGDPFDADDLVFAQNDVFNHPELFPARPSNPLVAEKVDQYTVTFTFEKPNSLFLLEQASTSGLGLLTKPRKYLEQFHIDHNPDADKEAKDGGWASWTEMFFAKAELWTNPDLPTLAPWFLTNEIGEASQVVLERNPYYWKVDPAGRQLPYIDKVVYSVISEAEVILTNVMNGDIDFQLRPSNTQANKPVLARNRGSGDFRFIDATPSNMSTMAFCFNFTHDDPVLREIFRDKRFRIGLSHAINRQEIIDTAYQRQGEPYQCAPRPESEFYDETFAKQYTEYDPEEAKRQLDQVLPDTDAQGFRLRPDGERLRITVEFALNIWPEYPSVLELIKGYWKEVGVELIVKGEDRSLFDVRTGEAQKHEAAVWQGAGGWNDIYLNAYYYLPTTVGATYWAYKWRQWFQSEGAEGEEPPEGPKRQIELWRDLQGAGTPEDRTAIMKEILEIARDEFYVLGINLQPPEYATATNRLRNVPKQMPNSWVYPTPGPTNPEQYYIEE